MPTRAGSGGTESVDTLVASAARTTNGDSGSWWGFGAARSLRLQFDATATVGTPTLTFFIEDSLDGVNWNSLTPTPALSVVSAVNRQVVNFEGVFADYIRIRWTITGTTPSVTFAVLAYSQGGTI